jgi:hypothetical protein
MQVRRVATVATLALLAAGAYAPATAAPNKAPIKKSYDMTLPPVPDASTSSACSSDAATGPAVHVETLTTTGPGVLSIKVTGFYGDWDMSVSDNDGVVGEGDGTSTPNTTPSTGTETFEQKFKKAATLTITTCNFAGSPQAHGEYTFTYSK